MRDATRSIVSNYMRGRPWLEKQDLMQEAALTKLEAARTWRPEGAPLEAYQARAMSFRLQYYVVWATSPVFAWTGRIGAMLAAHPCSLRAAGSVPAPGPSPEERIDKERIRRLVRRALSMLASGELAAAVLLGERKPAEVARARGVPIRKVYRATRDARKALRGDASLRALMEAVG